MRISLKRVGAIYHWRIGRIGGSFYIAKRKPQAKPDPRFALRLARIKGEH